ncbi:MAG TPA: presenilin family intramembrane aspartyl protease [Candidatus Nanoarchaeia archaeon]|nr:presenilin family intramembrane aspartyl protease [Candidatus Nanoarchaeia archaeon]
MKHTLKITLVLLVMFVAAQLIGIYVNYTYTPTVTTTFNKTTNTYENQTNYNIPYGFEPPSEIKPLSALTSIIFALVIAIALMLLLMKLKAEIFLRWWFFVVIVIGLAVAFNTFFISIQSGSLIALGLGLLLAYFKVFKRNLWIHNTTELFIYPGIAALFVPLLSLWVVIFLLIIISAYDMYAVWHAGFMQKMAKYQIEKVRVFSGFFVPYLAKGERAILEKAKASGKNLKKIKVHFAILGGGDVVFPIMLSGVLVVQGLFLSALLVTVGATIALALLFYMSKKGKFYPAMPFISAGCLAALILSSLIF